MMESSKSRARSTSQIAGFVVYVGPSRSAIFWAVIKGADRRDYYAYGKSFLSWPTIPRVGQQVLFTRLPPSPSSRLPRAIEVAVYNSDDLRRKVHAACAVLQ